MSKPTQASPNYDVVIVGAGIAGLTAAYRLRKADPTLSVCVLEAKDRVGGRTIGQKLKTSSGTDWWDLGGQWIGSTQIHVMKLITELRLDIYKEFTDGTKLQQLGGTKVKTYKSDIPSLSLWSLLDLHFLMVKLNKMIKYVDPEDPSTCPFAEEWDSITLAEFLRNHIWTTAAREAIESAGRCIFGAEPSHISLLYFLMYASAAGGLDPLISAKVGVGGQEYKVKGGAWQISHRLMEEIQPQMVRLAEPVLSINQESEEKVVVVSTKGRYVCRRVIIATPPLETVKMEFTPPLPIEKLHVLQKMHPGYITKIIVTYKECFWRRAGHSGEAVTSGGASVIKSCKTGPLCIVYDGATSNDNAALVGFIGGSQQIQYASISSEERKRAVLNSLAELYGNEALDYIDYCEKNWNEEPYNYGGPVGVGTPGMLTLLVPGLREPFDRAHFCGTEGATVWCGFMNGAVQTGYRAANEVLYNIRPQLIMAADLEGTWYDTRKPKTLSRYSRTHKVMRYTIGFGVMAISILCFKKYYSHRIFHI